MPANSSAGQKSYKFGLTVRGPGGKVTAKPVTVVNRDRVLIDNQMVHRPRVCAAFLLGDASLTA